MSYLWQVLADLVVWLQGSQTILVAIFNGYACEKTSDLVGKALLSFKVIALCDHCLTWEDGKDEELDKRCHPCIHLELYGHFTLIH